MLRFFIDRPIFASVISFVILLIGGTTLIGLPVEQYPNVVPPQIVVTAQYSGASAEVLSQSVAAPLEQEINGVDDMIYMESTSTDAGSLSVTVSFAMGTDPDQAAINVNNRVQAALPRLPQQVRELGVRVEARSSNILMVPVLSSTAMDTLTVSNYALLNVLDELVRIPGVGSATLFGAQDYAMRVWLRPDQLAAYGLTPADVAAVIREQNAQFASGGLGVEPSPKDQAFTYTVSTPEQMSSPEEFEDIMIHTLEDGSSLRLGDVARIELGALNYGFSATHNGKPTVPMGIFLQPGANALETASRVRAALEDLSGRFPEGMTYSIPYDTTEFVEIAIREVLITLLIATGLVVMITFLFLQHLRATLIPVVSIPVALIGTFAGMQAFGFSVNLLTLFGLVLAIGVVVDDAILVMENVERLMHEQHLRARDAAVETMKQVTGAVIATTLVLVAVFSPVTFMGGLTGVLYRQFAVTIVVSVVISSVVALTLTPALCALLLDRDSDKEVSRFFRWFNRMFERLTNVFMVGVSVGLRHPVIGVTLYMVMIGLTLFLLNQMPRGLVPSEDQGVALAVAKLPAAASLSRTEEVRRDLNDRLLEVDEIDDFISFAGFDIFSNSLRTNSAVGFVNLAPWRERGGKGQDAASIAGKIFGIGMGIPEAVIFGFVPPPIQGLSLTGGVDGYLQVRGDVDAKQINEIAGQFIAAAAERPELTNPQSTLDTGIPRYRATVDREKARAMGVPVNQVFAVMQSTFGSSYVNDFNYLGRLWQVNLQSEADFRSQPEDIQNVFVRAVNGTMIPLSELVRLERESGACSALFRPQVIPSPFPRSSPPQNRANRCCWRAGSWA